jgi:hypothetical protein
MGWGIWSPLCGSATAHQGITQILHDWARTVDIVEVTGAWELLRYLFLRCHEVLDQIP